MTRPSRYHLRCFPAGCIILLRPWLVRMVNVESEFAGWWEAPNRGARPVKKSLTPSQEGAVKLEYASFRLQ